jgi:cytoskeletal protein RodZ
VTSVQELSPTHPKAFGEELQRLRDGAGLTLDEIMLETKISRRILEALEAGKFHFLPEQVFCRNFVRQYARMINVDEESLVDAFDAAWQQFQLASGSHPALLVQEIPKPVIRWHFWVPIIVTIGIFIAITVVIVKGPRREPEIELNPRRQGREWATPATVPTRPQPPEAVEQGGESSSTVRIQLRVEEGEGKSCWVKYRDVEGSVREQMLFGGGVLNLELAGPVSLTLGNAGVVTLKIGDKVYEPEDLGRPSQKVDLEVNQAGIIDPRREARGE